MNNKTITLSKRLSKMYYRLEDFLKINFKVRIFLCIPEKNNVNLR